jgi:hypothetical protein
MICTMKDVLFDQTLNVKTAGISKLALDQIVARLRATGRVKWKGNRVTKEAVVNALWMWAGEMDPSLVEEAMLIYVPKLEATLKGESVPEDAPAPNEVADEVPPSSRVRRGKSG